MSCTAIYYSLQYASRKKYNALKGLCGVCVRFSVVSKAAAGYVRVQFPQTV